MRLPTPKDVVYHWHAQALAGLAPAIDDTPHCGWFKRKLVKGGVYVPARIWMVQEVDEETGELLSDELLQAEVNGAYADPEEVWSWICANPITEAEFNYLTARIAYALRNEPEDPFAQAKTPISMNKTPLHF